MSRAASRSRRLALLIALLFLAGALSGCLARGERDPELVQAVAGTRAMSWAPGNYWAYKAVFDEEFAFEATLIVHRVDALGFHLGSNASAGFFGLPFTGNVSSSLNPRIGPDEWPLFQFPLEDGKSWTYSMWGHSATTTAFAALVDVPGVGQVPGFTFESRAYGQLFARYDYTSVTGWFTRLELIEPSDGHRVLDVTLTAYGPDYGQAYYVEEAIRTVRITCPAAPGELTIEIPDGYLRVHALLTAEATGGAVDARLETEGGRVLAHARALAKQATADRASAAGQTGAWRLGHVCAGANADAVDGAGGEPLLNGRIYLEVTGLSPTGPLAKEPPADMPLVSWPSVFQSTRPALPQTGQVTSTGWPVAV